ALPYARGIYLSRGDSGELEEAQTASRGLGPTGECGAVNFSEIFIRRPIATSLLVVAIALFGVISYRALPVADLPTVDYPTLSISASLPGASPATMASAVATPLERQFTAIAGVDSMTSSSSLGSTSISLQFDLTRDIDGAAVDVVT